MPLIFFIEYIFSEKAGLEEQSTEISAAKPVYAYWNYSRLPCTASGMRKTLYMYSCGRIVQNQIFKLVRKFK